jgi:hypothetical protein
VVLVNFGIVIINPFFNRVHYAPAAVNRLEMAEVDHDVEMGEPNEDIGMREPDEDTEMEGFDDDVDMEDG